MQTQTIKLQNQLEVIISKLLETKEVKTTQQAPIFQKINNVLLISRDENYSKLVSKGITVDKLIKKLTSELKTISGHLKLYGKAHLDKFNKENFESLKSIRVPATDEATALITIKNVNKLDKETLLKCKEYIDQNVFSSIFEEKISFSLKEEFAEKVIDILRKFVGDEIVNNSFTKTTTLSLKSKEALNKFLSDESVDEKLREKVSDSIKLNEISITY